MFDLNQEFEKMAPNPVPEIQRKITRKIKCKLLFTKLNFLLYLGCSLTTVVLQLLALGVQDPLHFDFMDKPPTEVSRK